jgi:hypothetical protein
MSSNHLMQKRIEELQEEQRRSGLCLINLFLTEMAKSTGRSYALAQDKSGDVLCVDYDCTILDVDVADQSLTVGNKETEEKITFVWNGFEGVFEVRQ